MRLLCLLQTVDMTAGSSLGGVIWPIMLNHLINNGAGFAWAVRLDAALFIVARQAARCPTNAAPSQLRASAFITLTLLSIANLIMKTRLPSRKERANYVAPSIRSILIDVPYILCIIG